ncbi:MAG: amiloride-sensitive sodium channel family protein [Methanomassiliicoccaceae archaeon]|nr:amiloride-sensitive sodium channel family protein [Methanomassiliicoccaceae archaeon]
MSFLTNKSVGLMLIIIGLINIIAGLARAVNGVLEAEGTYLTIAAICFGIANLISGVLILGYGFKVRGGPNDESDIVSGLIIIIGTATILNAIFLAAGSFFTNYDADAAIGSAIWAAIVTLIVQIVLGLILIWAGRKVGGKNKNVLSKLLWIILIVVFLILAIWQFVTLFKDGIDLGNLDGILALIGAICWAVVYIYCFIAMLSADVKESMGV